MNLKYEDLHYSDLGASLRNFNDVIKTRKQGDMRLTCSNMSTGSVDVYGVNCSQRHLLLNVGNNHWERDRAPNPR